MRIPIAGGAQYGGTSGRSQDQSGATLDNFFVEPPLHDGDSGALVSMPGTTVVATAPGGRSIRAIAWPGFGVYAYVLAGQRLYQFHTTSYTFNALWGADTVPGTKCGFIEFMTIDATASEPGIMIVGAEDQAANPVRTGSTYLWFAPGIGVATSGSTSATFLDGRAIVQDKANTGRFYYSDLVDPTTWNALDFATAGASLDSLEAVLAHNRELILFGSKSIEVWFPTGNNNAPFERFQGGMINMGCVGAQTARRFDGSVAWLGRNEAGQLRVYRMGAGYMPEVISPPGLNAHFAQCVVPEDSFAFVFQYAGHEFYCLTFRTFTASTSETWCYDALTRQWNRWYDVDSSTKHSIQCASNGSSVALTGTARADVFVGYSNGEIAILDNTVGTERGATMTRNRICPPIRTGRRKARCHRVEVDMGHISDAATVRTTTLSANAAIGATVVTLTDVTSITTGDTLKVTCDNTWQHEALVTGISSSDVTINAPLPYAATAGNAAVAKSDSYVDLTWSKDGGRSFSSTAKRPIPSATSTQNTKLLWHKIGAGDDFQFKISVVSPAPVVVKDAYATFVGEDR